jgi:hypothetical protein
MFRSWESNNEQALQLAVKGLSDKFRPPATVAFILVNEHLILNE